MNVCGKRKALPPISGAEKPMGNNKPTRQRRTAAQCVCVCKRERESERVCERHRERARERERKGGRERASEHKDEK